MANSLQCRDENNKDVDWFTVYKIPKIKHHNQLIEDGLGYIYVTSKNYTFWTYSKYSINESDSIIGNTLQPFYSNKSTTSYVFYNDQPPNEPSKPSKGHTKGIILANSDGGFWLIHSTPHFPQLSEKYQFPKTGTKEGQSFLCISLDLKNLNKIGTQLQYNDAQIYSSLILEILKSKISQIVDAASGAVIKKAPWYNELSIISKNGTKFHSFAKSNNFGKDLYHDFIAPFLENDLFVESWPNGPGKLPSNCSNTFKVYNINNIKMEIVNTSFTTTEDHSKWAVSAHNSWICIGDINRMEHQKFRGGGSVCLNDAQLSDNYRNFVDSIEKCRNNSL